MDHGVPISYMVLSEGTVVITLPEALAPAEKALARTPAGAAEVQEFHRQLFASASGSILSIVSACVW